MHDQTEDQTDAVAGDQPEEGVEQLRLRVEAQDRLIEAMVAENADIHELRRRNHQLEQYVGKLLSLPGMRGALRLRRKVLRRPDAPGG